MIRRLILDVLKPHKPNVVEVSEALSHLEGVEGVNIIINEIDQQVENAKVIVAGSSISFEEIQKKLEELGAIVHSIDEVAAGKRIVEEVKQSKNRIIDSEDEVGGYPKVEPTYRKFDPNKWDL